MLKTYKYRLYPTRKQIEVLEKTLSLCCWLYNSALQEKIDIYKKYRKSVNCFYQINELPNCKKEIPELVASSWIIVDLRSSYQRA